MIIRQLGLAIGVLTSNRKGVGYQLWRGSRWAPLLGAIAGVPPCRGAAGCHCWVPLLNAISGCQLLDCHCWVPPCRGAAGCHCWVPLLGRVALLGAIAGCSTNFPTLGAIARCHCWMPLRESHCWVPLREKIGQSDTPFSATSFSTLITHKLACVIWGLCWYNSLDVNRDHIRPVFPAGPQPPAIVASVRGN